MTEKEIQKTLRQLANKDYAKKLQRFFKTGPGEYGEGDVFIGVRMPDIRTVAQRFFDLPFSELTKLLASSVHEERMLALIILTLRFAATKQEVDKKIIFDFYLAHKTAVNNWDLVDVSVHKIIGAYLRTKGRKERKLLYDLAESNSLWDRRMAIVATASFIAVGQYSDTLRLVAMFLRDQEDLIHKASGWMLREVGKWDKTTLDKFIAQYGSVMPRTMLRYAIEKYPEKERKQILYETKS